MSKVKPTDDRKTPLNDTKATDAELLQVNVDSRPSTTGSNRSVALSTTSEGGDETGIKVVVRMRPMNEREIKLKSKPCVDVNSPLKEIQIKRKDKEDKKFYFDDVFGETSTQMEVFASTGARVLERFVLGFNVGFQVLKCCHLLQRLVYLLMVKQDLVKVTPCKVLKEALNRRVL